LAYEVIYLPTIFTPSWDFPMFYHFVVLSVRWRFIDRHPSEAMSQEFDEDYAEHTLDWWTVTEVMVQIVPIVRTSAGNLLCFVDLVYLTNFLWTFWNVDFTVFQLLRIQFIVCTSAYFIVILLWWDRENWIV
jgi:hypothetical protein